MLELYLGKEHAEAIFRAGFSSAVMEKAAQEKVNPDDILSDDMKYFAGTIAPYIKDRTLRSHPPKNGPISFKYYGPDFYKNIEWRVNEAQKNPIQRGGVTREINKNNDMGITMDPGISEERPDLVMHEVRHAQNLSPAKDRYNRTEYEDGVLSRAYGFNPDAIRLNYGIGSDVADEIGPDHFRRLAKEEEAATNAQYQWMAFMNQKAKLGRRPTPEEYVEGWKGMTIPELRSLRGAFGKPGANLYEPVLWAYDASNKWAKGKGYKSINDFQESVKEKIFKLIEDGKDPDEAVREIMSLPEIKSMKDAVKGVGVPEYTDDQLEAFREAGMNVARNGRPHASRRGNVKSAQAQAVAGAVSKAAKGAAKGAGMLGKLKLALSALGGGYNIAKEGISDVKSLIKTLGALSLYGVGLGTFGGLGYNIAKNRMMQESPEDEANRKIEAMYSNKRRELEDSMWMDRVRSMRDELRRNYRRMSTEEYTKKYVDLMDALNERSS